MTECIPISPGLLTGRFFLVIEGSFVVAVSTGWTDAAFFFYFFFFFFFKRALAFPSIDTIRVVVVDCLAEFLGLLTRRIFAAPVIKCPPEVRTDTAVFVDPSLWSEALDSWFVSF